MATALKKKNEVSPYERDFYAWLNQQAEKLRGRSHNELDWDNLAEEIESVGRNQKNEISKRLAVLIAHLLKWHFQPRLRSHSWQSTISGQRIHIEGLLQLSPSLKRYPAETLEWSYGLGRRRASYETKIDISKFPETCPYAIEDILDSSFHPGEPWSPDDLLRD